VQAQPGRVEGIGLEFVEFRVLLVLDLTLAAQPERLDRVDAFAVKIDGKLHEGGIAFEDVLDLRGEAEFGAVVLELHDDLAAPPLPFGFLDRIFAGTVGLPDVAGLGKPPRMGVNLHAFCHHERAVEANAKLADQAGVLGLAFAQGLEKRLGAGVGDGAEILDQFGPRHADAEIPGW